MLIIWLRQIAQFSIDISHDQTATALYARTSKSSFSDELLLLLLDDESDDEEDVDADELDVEESRSSIDIATRPLNIRQTRTR